MKYFGKKITHTSGTLHAIPSGILDRFAKLTSQKPSIHSKGLGKIYPDHANALRKAGLAPPNLSTMGDLWRNQDEKVDIFFLSFGLATEVPNLTHYGVV